MPSRYSTQEVIHRFKITHPKNRYDYSKFELTLMNNKSIIVCHKKDKNGKEHGEFLQSPTDHILGRGCPKCRTEKCGKICNNNNKKNTIPFDIMVQRFNQAHNNRYTYIEPKVFRGYRQKIEIICPDHEVFIQQVQSHLNGAGCPNCLISKGENKIKEFLIKHKIFFIPQYRPEGCKNKFQLSFDFYLPDYNTCIEYDGKQHFQPVQYGGISLQEATRKFKNNQTTNQIKNEYCQDNNIRLLRIPHWDYKNIENILSKNLLAQFLL